MTPSPTYAAMLREMFALQRFGIRLGLETIGGILERLGNPQERFAALHVAGTNGKGSIAATLEAILAAGGHTVGLYTSPHLVRFNERIRVNGRDIGDEQVMEAYRAVTTACRGGRKPTFFEVTTAMALYEFGRRAVQWAVIEAGMGGRLDATNLITPALSIITNISLEHRQYLGNTIAKIAGEKAGIIKPGVPVVTGVRQKSAVAVIEARSARESAPLFRRGVQFRTRGNRDGSFDYHGIDHSWRHLHPRLLGGHQVENAAIVLAACELLMRAGVSLDLAAIRRGFDTTRWPGRLEIVAREPLVILDGAHNLEAAKRLADFLDAGIGGRRLTLVVGILDDKPYAQMLAVLLPRCSRLVVTRPRIGRALPTEALRQEAGRYLDDIFVFQSVEEAVTRAVRGAGAGEAVCIAGSLYVVGEAKEALEKHPGLLAGTAAGG